MNDDPSTVRIREQELVASPRERRWLAVLGAAFILAQIVGICSIVYFL